VKRGITMGGYDIVSLETCDRIMQLVYPVKDVICKYKPCSFNSRCWPSILDAFPFGGVLLLSYLHGYIHKLVLFRLLRSQL
ncbi:hypothetical protein P691DRAFT_688511, partial [Macrolepiota fuliginosa MF-IS2]